MRVLTIIVILAGVLYGGYWFIGARMAERGAADALARMEARGWQVEHAGLSVAGFPNRFDMTLTEPRFASPDHRLGWQAPFLQVFSLSYSPWKLIAALPNDQKITLDWQEIAVGSTRMQASLFMRPSTELPLDRFDAVTEGLSLRSDQGWAFGTGSGNLSVIAGDGAGAEIAFRFLDLVPDAGAMAVLDGTALPATIERVDFLADAKLTAPLALREPPPRVTGVHLREANVIWGPVKLRATGTVTAGADGYAEGQIDIRVENWREALDAIEAAGLVADQFQVALRSMLTKMAGQGTDPAVLDLPLVLKDGWMSLGPLPLGQAPRF